eukprot:scaffold112062_cov57-Phaeocystis_antarctica.AAC.2
MASGSSPGGACQPPLGSDNRGEERRRSRLSAVPPTSWRPAAALPLWPTSAGEGTRKPCVPAASKSGTKIRMRVSPELEGGISSGVLAWRWTNHLIPSLIMSHSAAAPRTHPNGANALITTPRPCCRPAPARAAPGSTHCRPQSAACL